MKGFHNITREYKKLDYKLMIKNEIIIMEKGSEVNQWVENSPRHFY